MRSWITWAIAVVVIAVPEIAAACPVCAGNENAGGVGRVVALGGMILLPFFIAFFVIRAIRANTAPDEIDEGMS